AKLTLEGEVVWEKYAPMEAGVYAPDEDTTREKIWGRDRFMPTNFAFLDDGGFLLADGYGSFYIHRYDKDGEWQSCFGGPGGGQGKFATPHGIWMDRRKETPTVIICDRAHHTLQWLTLEGKHIETIKGFGLPANVDIKDEHVVVPELGARLTILDVKNQKVAQLGSDVERINGKEGKKIRGDKSQWLPGKFIHPHDACFDANGNIFVAEWVAGGRVTLLEKI
ncbi:MAG: hypothetical protein AAGA30_22185, partial [Planctomycetota bacterium]